MALSGEWPSMYFRFSHGKYVGPANARDEELVIALLCTSTRFVAY